MMDHIDRHGAGTKSIRNLPISRYQAYRYLKNRERLRHAELWSVHAQNAEVADYVNRRLGAGVPLHRIIIELGAAASIWFRSQSEHPYDASDRR